MNQARHINNREVGAYTNKDGLIRSLLLIIVGIIFLSYIGFDLREKVSSFENEYSDEISTAQDFFNSFIKPGAEQVFDSSQEGLEKLDINEETIGTFIDFIKEFFRGVSTTISGETAQ